MRDPRKNSAFASGMRGREKPTIAGAHGGTYGQTDSATAGGEKKQGPSTVVGDPDGVPHTDRVYASGMRGLETGKQKPAAKDGGAGGGENKQGAGTIGTPDGTDTSGRGARAGVSDAHIQSTAKSSRELGIPGNNTEAATSEIEPIGAEEDDTHINVRIPKSALKKKQGAGQAV